jgi:VWFA-related protein
MVLVDFRGERGQQPVGISLTEGRTATQEAVLDTLQTLADASGRAARSDQQRVVTAMTRSLSDLAKLMGSVEGRKYVVYLSEGFDTAIVSGTQDQERQQEITEQAYEGTGYLTDSAERFGSSETLNDVERMLEEFRRADCVVQAVDIGGLKTDTDMGVQRKGGRDSLLQIAKGTGGELYENTNDLSGAMDEMLKRTGVTYVLAVQPDALQLDGAYHKLKVELKNAPRGTRVVHRPGYYAPRPYAEQSPLEKLLATANQVTSGQEAGSVLASVLAAPFRVAGEKAYVPVLLEVDGASLLAGKQGTALPIEVFIYALDQGGAVHDFVTQTVGLDLAKVEPVLRQNGFKFFGHVDLLPGEYSLRVLVRNGTTGASATRVVEVSVPQFAAQSPVLLPPFFPEPPNRWVLVREGQEPGEKQVPYPFMQRDQPYIPAARPVLGNQDVAVSLVGYNLGAGDPKVEAKVMAADGKEVGAGVLKLGARESGGAAGPDRFAATFRPPNLPPGEYVLQVTLTDAGGTAKTSYVAFAVGAIKG